MTTAPAHGTLTDRQLESLRFTLWAELQLPEAPDFLPPDARGMIRSQEYTSTTGFMAKFVTSYHITLRPHAREAGDLFDAACTIDVSYQHGHWTSNGSDGVSTTLFHSVKLQKWVTLDGARELQDADRQERTDR